MLAGFAVLPVSPLRGEEWGELSFSLTEASFLREEGMTLRLYYSVPYDQLRFLSIEGAYLARIYVTAVCLDSKGNQKAGDIWDRRIRVQDYEETKLRTRSFLDSLSFPVEPGEYVFRVGVRDRNSQRSGSKEMQVEVKDLRTARLAVSDLRFLFPSESTWVLNPGRTYDGSDPLVVSFEVYSSHPSTLLLTQHWSIEDQDGGTVVQGESSIKAPEEVNREILEVPLDSLSPGKHVLTVSIEDQEGKTRAETRGTFSYQPPAFLSKEGYLKMVEQLEYIAESDELRKLREAEQEERERIWQEFWKERDPSPGTERNEAREEYFRRVEYANRHFSSFKEGWRTDMGRIYIIYGKPDEIERHPFDLNSRPYEIWYYYGEGLRFVFLDEHGLGDYKLIYPKGR